MASAPRCRRAGSAESRAGSGGVLQRHAGAARRPGGIGVGVRQSGFLSPRQVERGSAAPGPRFRGGLAAGQRGGPRHGVRAGCHRRRGRGPRLQGRGDGRAAVIEGRRSRGGGGQRPVAADACNAGRFPVGRGVGAAFVRVATPAVGGVARAAAQRNADPALLLRFDFESSPDLRVLPNVAAQHGRWLAMGPSSGCEPTEGRWPGKGRTRLPQRRRPRPHPRPRPTPQRDLAAWVRVDGLDRTFNSLLMSQGYDAGALHWQINQKGVVHIGVRGEDKRARTTTGRRWSSRRSVRTLDASGRGVRRGRGPRDALCGRSTGRPAADSESVPLQIGYADIGNWSVGTHSTIYPVRHFSGRMDELVIYGRALADEEIKQLYATGTPQPVPGQEAREQMKNKMVVMV